MQSRTDKLTVAAVSAGHFVNDSYSNLLSPLLPPLISKLGLSLSQAGLLGGALIFSSSLMQPLYGYLGDRHVRRAFAIYGPLLTAVCMSSLGAAPSYLWLFLLLLLAGVGIAAFHPQGAALVAHASKSNRSLGMTIFVTSGSIGYGLGPSLVTALIFTVGLDKSYLAAIPALLICLVLIRACPADMSSIRQPDANSQGQSLKAVWRPLAVLCSLVILRSAVQFGLAQFLPLYFTERGYSLRQATFFLTLFLLSGGLGGFMGGNLANRFGGRRIIAYSMLFTSPLLLAFLLLPGVWSIVSLALAGLVLLCTLPINVVMAQELAPHRTSTVSALMMGFSWGFGGIFFVPWTGFVADHLGLQTAFLFLALLPLAGYIVSLKVPETVRQPPAGIQDRQNYSLRSRRLGGEFYTAPDS